MTVDARRANRLAGETSPYLLQHAYNPVDWYPWGEEAFAKARSEDKPILLSVGYSTCHWCHVMEREGFEDEVIARQLAEGFVAIKVDREELPDVDHVYMSALQTLTGQGGWPMNMFLTPRLEPFFGGTYFPPQPRRGMPSFSQVLAAVREAWLQSRAEIEDQARGLMAHVQAGTAAARRRTTRGRRRASPTAPGARRRRSGCTWRRSSTSSTARRAAAATRRRGCACRASRAGGTTTRGCAAWWRTARRT